MNARAGQAQPTDSRELATSVVEAARAEMDLPDLD
jgi:hypothetical protein